MRRIRTAAVLAVITACGGATLVAVTSATATPTAVAARGATVKLMRTGLGKILVASNGRTLYIFTHDKRNVDRCTAASGCAGIWPAYTTKTKPTGGPGVNARLLGTIKHGARRQVTYAGHPLYKYSGDTGPGQTGYVGTPEFGGTWYAINAKGKTVK